MRNVETLDALRQLRQPQRILQRFLNGFGIRLHHPEALVVRLLGVVAGQVEQPTLVPTLRNQNMNPCGAGALARHLLGKQVFQRFTIFEINRHINIPRNVRLTNVELLHEGGKEFAGKE